MFGNINTREIEINISKTNTWKNDVLLQYSYSILQLYDNSFQIEWSTKFVIYQSFFQWVDESVVGKSMDRKTVDESAVGDQWVGGGPVGESVVGSRWVGSHRPGSDWWFCNRSKDKTYMKIKRKFFWKNGKWCSHESRIQNVLWMYFKAY